MNNIIPLINTGCWSDESSEKYCCEIAVSLLSCLRNEVYTNFVRADREERGKTACDLTFMRGHEYYFLKHTSLSAYKKQHEDQGSLAKAQSVCRNNIEKLLKYKGIRILVAQAMDIPELYFYGFYKEIIPVSRDIDHIFYVDCGHKDKKKRVASGVPVYYWQKQTEEILLHIFNQENNHLEYRAVHTINL
jgi:hypothetical protein